VQIYYKLFSMSLPRLRLIRLFLRAMAGTDAARQIAKIEAMLPGLNRSVDMGVVSILSWYDKCAFEASDDLASASVRAPPGSPCSMNFSKVVLAVGKLKGRGATFLPHCTTVKPERRRPENPSVLGGSAGAGNGAFSTRGPLEKAVSAQARERWRSAFRQVRKWLKDGRPPAGAAAQQGARLQSELLCPVRTHPSVAEDSELVEFAANVDVVAREQLREAGCSVQASMGGSLQVRPTLTIHYGRTGKYSNICIRCLG
jgi:hypothetical protein